MEISIADSKRAGPVYLESDFFLLPVAILKLWLISKNRFIGMFIAYSTRNRALITVVQSVFPYLIRLSRYCRYCPLLAYSGDHNSITQYAIVSCFCTNGAWGFFLVYTYVIRPYIIFAAVHHLFGRICNPAVHVLSGRTCSFRPHM